MPAGRILALILAAIGTVFTVLTVGVVVWATRDGDPATPITLALALAAGAFGVLWMVLSRLFPGAIKRLAGDVRLLADSRARQPLDPARYPTLRPLPQAVNVLAAELARWREGVEGAIAEATKRAEEQKARLEALLRDLSEGVIVCNLEHEILLYNHRAVRLLGGAAEFGLGRSLFRFVAPEPVRHALDWLLRLPDQARGDAGGTLACATTDSRTLLHGRMSVVFDERRKATGYVLTLTDATPALTAIGQREGLLRAALDETRGPIANLRAAAETLASHPGMEEERRRAFEQILVDESASLSERIAALTRQQRVLISDLGVMADLYSSDLINCVIRQVRDAGGPEVVMIGLPQWLRGDSYALMKALAWLIARVHGHARVPTLDLEARPSERGCTIDLVWRGEPLPSASISSWLDLPVTGDALGMSLRRVLEAHHSDLWSQIDRPGFARLRMPLPRAVRGGTATEGEPLPHRPEFYDFDLLHLPAAAPEVGRRPLKTLTHVVFDTETTGLAPTDEVVAIAGVRIVNGRILTGETFDRLVNPGRPIPPASSAIHHITNSMVRDKPPLTVVLPQFKAFVADAVLVAHNIAFDLSFLKAKEGACDVCFDNPILDTMLLSLALYGPDTDHSLDALIRRFGIDVSGRHTALGDSLAAAAILLALFEALEKHDIRTLDQASQVSRVAIETRARQAQMAAVAGSG